MSTEGRGRRRKGRNDDLRDQELVDNTLPILPVVLHSVDRKIDLAVEVAKQNQNQQE